MLTDYLFLPKLSYSGLIYFPFQAEELGRYFRNNMYPGEQLAVVLYLCIWHLIKTWIAYFEANYFGVNFMCPCSLYVW